MTDRIDIVIPWVDGEDPQWKERFLSFSKEMEGDAREIRYRNWGLLRYWFRGIEKFAPWIGKIHFITSGELPTWLNLEHPKLNWVKHEDYIPASYLPTFSANTIEMNVHRIKGLSERFVYFNDDCFITRSIQPTRFFKGNLPCDFGVMTAKPSSGGIIHMAINDLEVIEKHFNKHQVIKKHFFKWINPHYGVKLINNLLLLPWTEFSGFIDPHLPNAFLKETFEKVWQAEPQILEKTCMSKFRTNNDVNQWLIRYWQLAEGNFKPQNIKKNTLNSDIDATTINGICNSIKSQHYDIICINDSVEITDFEQYKKSLQDSFEYILPEKSSFES